MKEISFLTGLFIVTACTNLNAISRTEALQLKAQADSAYAQSQWEHAYTLYHQLEAEWNSFALQYNLGNACFKLDRIGEAILHYERARKINPTDDDLRTNLQIANLRVADKIEALPALGVDDIWKNLTAEKTLPYWTWSTMALLIIGFSLLSYYVWKRRTGISRLFVPAGIVFIFTAAFTYGLGNATAGRIRSAAEAVIMVARTSVHSAPDSGASVAFELHEGTKVSLRNEQGDWYEIRIANGNVGWVKKKDTEVI